ncbi:MAG TPA: hypothetical protein VIT42_14520 [Microlunatus sp.]
MTDRVDPVSLQRDGLDGLAGDGAEPLDTLQAPAAGTFSDRVNVSTTEVPIVVRNDAFDFVNAVQARFGGDGDRCTVAPTSFTPDVDALGRVTGAHLVWNVAVLVPTVQAEPTARSPSRRAPPSWRPAEPSLPGSVSTRPSTRRSKSPVGRTSR